MRKNVHVCLSHMELQRLQGCALATRCLHHFVCAVSEGFEPSRAERMLTYYGDRRSCSESSGQEMCFLAMLRNGDGLVLRTRRSGKQSRSDRDDVVHENDLVKLHQKNLQAPDKQADVVWHLPGVSMLSTTFNEGITYIECRFLCLAERV